MQASGVDTELPDCQPECGYLGQAQPGGPDVPESFRRGGLSGGPTMPGEGRSSTTGHNGGGRSGAALVGHDLHGCRVMVPAQDQERDYDRHEVLKSVLELPEAQRVTVLLVYIEGYSYKAAAEILDIPLATVMSRLATARSNLGRKFRDQKGMSRAR